MRAGGAGRTEEGGGAHSSLLAEDKVQLAENGSF